ncbi:endolytic transglycosylase MltG [Candidatus Poribacteria bacterium]|nr:endolytic transglycosylase MltG [Candidatus Poribacteria bacterium]MYB66177.1 endolytic transglycosylase MltG [Candidatus Poribacteria bacterium]
MVAQAAFFGRHPMFVRDLASVLTRTRFRRYCLYALGSIGVLCLSAVLVFGYYMSPTASSEELVSITITPGSNTTTIANHLVTHNLIRSSLVFRLVVRYRGIGTKLRAGNYQLSRDMSLNQILDEIKKGQITYQTFTVPEGKTAKAIAELWEMSDLGAADLFIEAMQSPELLQKYIPEGVSVEGYLFPSTYKFAEGSTARTVVRMMLSEFEKRWDETLAEEAEALGFTRHEIITLASIIEREAASKEEIPIISGVFHNRLKDNWRLQADPTVLYALGEPKRLLTRADLAYVSPYNTYLNKGLPPGPIGNPGMASILGALRPEETEFYYFVATDEGKHHFSKTLAEHNRMRRIIKRKKALTNTR